jgi:hypothetical protein
MRIYTVHPRAGQEPVLVREGFSWGAFLLPTLWFLWNRMWLVAFADLVLMLAIGLLLPDRAAAWVALAAQILLAMHARDLRRWTLARRGFALVGVVAAANEEEAVLRLAAERPDLLRGTAVAGPVGVEGQPA